MGAAAELFIKISADAKAAIKGFAGAEKAAQDLGKGVNAAAGEYSAAASKIDAASSSMAASAKGVGDAARGVGGALGDAGKKASAFGDVFKGAFAGTVVADLALKSIGAFTGQITNAFNALARIEQINAQTSAAIASTGGAANVTAAQIAAYSGAIERKTGVEAESVQIGQNLLLTFTAIQNKAGEGNQIFDRATDAMVNLSVAMGTDTKSAAMQLGKALQDPTKGMESLRRSGFSFSEAQKETVKALDASGKRMEAQKIILAELERQFGTSAEAFGKTLPGAIIRAEHALTSLTEAMLMPALPYITNAMGLIAELAFYLAEALAAPGSSVVSAFNAAFGPEVKAAVIGIGAAMTGALTPAILGVGRAFLAATAAAAPFIMTAAAVGFTAYAIMQNWDVLRGFWIMTMEAMGAGVTWLRNQVSRIFGDVGQIVGDTMMYIGLMVRETLGEDVAAKLGIGLEKASEIMRSFGQVAAETIAPIGAGLSALAGAARDNMITTWGGAFDSARLVYSQLTAETQNGSVKMAAAINQATGATAAAGKTAKQTADEKKRLAQQMQEASSKAMVYYGAMVNIFRLYQQQATATRNLAASLKAVDDEAAKQGRSFDVAGARAKAYEASLKGIESAFGVMSPQATAARAAMEAFSQASADGGAATAAAYGIIDEASRALKTQAEVAAALGKDYDELGESIKSAETVLTKLIERGLKPGNKAYDEMIRKLEQARAGLKKKETAIQDVASAMGSLLGQSNRLLGDIKSLADAFGLKGVSSAIEFAQAAMKVGDTLMGIPALVVAIGTAFTNVSALIAANPIAAAILAIVGVVAIAGSATYMWLKNMQDESIRATEEARALEESLIDINARNMENLESSNLAYRQNRAEIEATKATQDAWASSISNAVASAVKNATMAFIAGATDWKEKLRSNMKEAIFQGLIDAIVSKAIVAQFDDIIGQIVGTFGNAVDTGREHLYKQLEEKMISTAETLGEVGVRVAKAIGISGGEAQQLAQATLNKAQGMRGNASNIATLSASRNALNIELTRLSNVAGGRDTQEYRNVLNRINELNEWIRMEQSGMALPTTSQYDRMATGGLVTGPTIARMGEGGRHEAVLPLNDSVYRRIAHGISGAGAGGVVVNVNYSGNGKWTREDAQGLGRLLVSELRSMGVKA